MEHKVFATFGASRPVAFDLDLIAVDDFEMQCPTFAANLDRECGHDGNV